MSNREFLTRTCIVCSVEKPLSAFLQITGKQGTVYGAICFSCRSAGKTEKAKPHDDERSSTSSGMRIGAKQRLEIEQKQKQEYREREQKREEHAKKHEQVSLNTAERIEKQEKAEKDHRELFIEEKKKAFLNYQSKKMPASIKTLIGQPREQTSAQTVIAEDKIRLEEASKKEEAVKKNEARVTTLDAMGAPIIMSNLNRNNAIFREFLARLPKDSAIVKAFSKTEDPREFIEKTWGPSSRKK